MAVQFYSNLKLYRPYVHHDKRIGISNIDKIIDDNYAINSKWTIIRDIDGHCLNKVLAYNSEVIEMDIFEKEEPALITHANWIRKTVLHAIAEGLWV